MPQLGKAAEVRGFYLSRESEDLPEKVTLEVCGYLGKKHWLLGGLVPGVLEER